MPVLSAAKRIPAANSQMDSPVNVTISIWSIPLLWGGGSTRRHDLPGCFHDIIVATFPFIDNHRFNS